MPFSGTTSSTAPSPVIRVTDTKPCCPQTACAKTPDTRIVRCAISHLGGGHSVGVFLISAAFIISDCSDSEVVQ